MIIYSPIDGDPLTHSLPSRPRECFLMTRLGAPIPKEINNIRESITVLCSKRNYQIIDAATQVTGRDFLLKIWRLIASTPIAIGICHEEVPAKTQANIFYEFGVAQALGKETVIIKSINAEIPSDFIRTEYIEYNKNFDVNFLKYLDSVDAQAEHYQIMAEQLDKNPILAIDYLKRAFLITGDNSLRTKAQQLLNNSSLEDRAKNSVEYLVANF